MKRLYVMVLSTLWAPALAAQGTVVLPEPPLDSARITLRDDLLRFRDTLNSIDAAAARLQRDFREASTAALLSRARVMSDACARSARNLPLTHKAVLAADTPDKRRRKSRGEMVQALDRLRGVLSRCSTDFEAMARPGEGETVRGYGNARAIPVQTALRRYERVLASFFSAMGIKVSPLGAPVRPLAS